MRKPAWLLLTFICLSACGLPFNLMQSSETVAEIVPLTETLQAVSVEEALAVEACPACPTCGPAIAECSEMAEDMSPLVTEMAATIEAYRSELDIMAAMPPMPEPVLADGGMPALTATADTGNPLAALPEAMPGVLQSGGKYRSTEVTYKQNFAHPDKGCNWMGIAGQVLDGSGLPVKNLVVVAEGVLLGQEVREIDLTGLHTAYGPGGYELEIGSQVVASANMIYVTVFDLEGNALSSPVSITTRADCKQNLLVLNFQQMP